MPSRRSIDASRESGSKIRKTHAEWGIFEAQAREIAHRRCIPNTAANRPAHTSGDIDFLFERERGNLSLCLFVSVSPRSCEIGDQFGIINRWGVLR